MGTTPGTPNSQAMRPTPSPTGSAGSRSMSPAVGKFNLFNVEYMMSIETKNMLFDYFFLFVGQQSVQMPPRPSSNHSQVSNQTNNNSNTNQQQQQQPPPSIIDQSSSSTGQQQRSTSVVGSVGTGIGLGGGVPQSQQPIGPPSSAGSNVNVSNNNNISNMTTQGSYPPQLPASHIHSGYKMGPSPGGPGMPQNLQQYPAPQSQQYSQGTLN